MNNVAKIKSLRLELYVVREFTKTGRMSRVEFIKYAAKELQAGRTIGC